MDEAKSRRSAASDRGGNGYLSPRRLRQVAVLLPAATVVVFVLALELVVEPALGMSAGHAIATVAMLAGVVAFSHFMLRAFDDKERTIAAQVDRVRVLSEIGAELSALLDVERIAAIVVERSARLLGADAAGLARLDSTGGLLYWQHFVGVERNATSVETIRLASGEGIAGYVVATGRPLIIEDATSGLPEGITSAPILEAAGLRSAAAVPVRTGERVIGALMVGSSAPRTYTDQEVSDLSSLGHQIAIAVLNAELYNSAQLAAERLERLIESSGDAIITSDFDGRILSWNHGAEAIYGWSRAEAIGSRMPMVPQDLLEEALGILRHISETGEPLLNLETERLRKNGLRIPVVVTASLLRNPAGQPIGLLGISKDMSARKRLEEQERKLALLDERERIGMELHDGAIQSLYAIGLGIETVAQVVDHDPALARMRLAKARDGINEVIAEIRKYIVGLGTDTFATSGLVATLANLAREMQVNALIAVDLSLDTEAAEMLSDDQAREVVPFAREALSNVTRHSRATQSRVALRQVDGGCELLIWDNGVGLDPTGAHHSGFGLRNMAERARRLGARLEMTSASGAGAEIRLQIPCHEVGRPD